MEGGCSSLYNEDTKPMKTERSPLLPYYSAGILEAGLDEAGRGCLAGPVVAAAVILPQEVPEVLAKHLNDSKKLSEKQREAIRPDIERLAIAWGIGMATPEEIDEINILNASILAMHRAVDVLGERPEHLIVDGNRFKAYKDIEHKTIVGGDAKYMSIAAASILAKTERDRTMNRLSEQYPQYQWGKNKGYPTKEHYAALAEYGPTPLHRQTFRLK